MSSQSDPAKEIREYLAEWLDRYRAATDVAGFVQRQLDLAVWQEGSRRALDRANVPDEVKFNVDDSLARNLNELRVKLPLPIDYKPFLTDSMTVVGSTAVYTSAVTVGVLEVVSDSPNPPREIDEAIEGYKALQEKQQRFAEARDRLDKQFPGVVPLLDVAERKFQLAKSDPQQIPDAAIEMRNVLEKLQGKLFAKAKRHPKENMTWPTMVERLTGAGTAERVTLHGEGVARGQLVTSLSELLKRRTALDAKRLEVAWTLVIDHVFVVCGCI